MDMARKDMGDMILMKEGGQPGSGLLRQGMMIFTSPRVKEGVMEKHQASLIRPGIFLIQPPARPIALPRARCSQRH